MPEFVDQNQQVEQEDNLEADEEKLEDAENHGISSIAGVRQKSIPPFKDRLIENEFPSEASGLGVGIDQGLQVGMSAMRAGVHDLGDGFPDAREMQAMSEESFDGDFVGGVQHGGEGASGFSGATGEERAGKSSWRGASKSRRESVAKSSGRSVFLRAPARSRRTGWGSTCPSG